MGLKNIKEFSAEEVGMWLTVQGLGVKAETFIAEGVDGDLLLDLTEEEFKNDLGLSGLQTKKIMKNIAFTQELIEEAEGGGSEKEVSELEGKIKTLSDENESLEEKLESLEVTINEKDTEIEELKKQIEGKSQEPEEEIPVVQGTPVPEEPEPEPAPPAAQPVHHKPAPAPAPQRRRGAPVVRGAAGGAAGGALKGAVGKIATCHLSCVNKTGFTLAHFPIFLFTSWGYFTRNGCRRWCRSRCSSWSNGWRCKRVAGSA